MIKQYDEHFITDKEMLHWRNGKWYAWQVWGKDECEETMEEVGK